MALRILPAGRDRIDELGPLWLQLHHPHARVSRVQPFVDDELAARGITGLVIGVMEGNDGARRLYERRGLVPGWVQLYRVAA